MALYQTPPRVNFDGPLSPLQPVRLFVDEPINVMEDHLSPFEPFSPVAFREIMDPWNMNDELDQEEEEEEEEAEDNSSTLAELISEIYRLLSVFDF